jgi:hypothetical protein
VELRFAQSAQHARVVAAGILSDNEDQIGTFEIIEAYRPLTDADGFLERDAARFVTEVRTVR